MSWTTVQSCRTNGDTPITLEYSKPTGFINYWMLVLDKTSSITVYETSGIRLPQLHAGGHMVELLLVSCC